MSREILPRGEEIRPPLTRDYTEFETIIGLDYYGIVLPPDVEAYMLRLWAQINALENDLRVFYSTKYGATVPGTDTAPPAYKTPPEKWEPSDLSFVQAFDKWVAGYRQFARDYIEGSCKPDMNPVLWAACRDAHVAWQWAGSNSLTVYKQTEAYEKQYTDWRAQTAARGIQINAPEAKDAVTKVDLKAAGDALGSVVKWATIGVLGFAAFKVYQGMAPAKRETKSEAEIDRDAHKVVG